MQLARALLQIIASKNLAKAPVLARDAAEHDHGLRSLVRHEGMDLCLAAGPSMPKEDHLVLPCCCSQKPMSLMSHFAKPTPAR